MANLIPFKAWHYNVEMIPEFSDVVTEPYDNIPAGEDKMLWERHPHNFAHVLLPKKKTDEYTHAAELLSRWRADKILIQDTAPHFYLYQQIFAALGQEHRRNTLIAAINLSEFSHRTVRPHEKTHGEPKTDRLKILKATQCNLSPVFGVVRDKEGFLQTLYDEWVFLPVFLKTTTRDGVQHTIWRLDAGVGDRLKTFFEDKPLYLVDGHHRYEVALAHAKELGVLGNDHPASSILFGIANAFDPALVVFPTHRIIRGVQYERVTEEQFRKAFDVTPATYAELQSFVQRPNATPQFAIYLRERLLMCTPKQWESEAERLGHALCRLSVVWSDGKFLGEVFKMEESEREYKIEYERDLERAWAQRRSANVIIFLPPLAVEDVTAVADEGGFLPQKSTYFYPKLPAGFLIRDLKTG